MGLSVQQGHDLAASACVAAAEASDGRGDHLAAGLFDSPTSHTGVRGFDDHGHALGLELGHEQVGDLRGEAFLDLRAMGELVDDAGEFGDSHDLAIGEVGDVGLPLEGHEVVLAHGVEGDVAEDDQLVVTLGEGGREMLGRIFPQAAEQLGVHLGDAFGGLTQPLAVGVFADGAENVSDSSFDTLKVHARRPYRAPGREPSFRWLPDRSSEAVTAVQDRDCPPRGRVGPLHTFAVRIGVSPPSKLRAGRLERRRRGGIMRGRGRRGDPDPPDGPQQTVSFLLAAETVRFFPDKQTSNQRRRPPLGVRRHTRCTG